MLISDQKLNDLQTPAWSELSVIQRELSSGFDKVYIFYNGILQNNTHEQASDNSEFLQLKISAVEGLQKYCFLNIYDEQKTEGAQNKITTSSRKKIDLLDHSNVYIFDVHLGIDNVEFHADCETTLLLQENASLEYAQIFCMNNVSKVKNVFSASLNKNAKNNCVQIMLNAADLKNNFQFHLAGAGAELEHNVLVRAGEKQKIETDSFIEHVVGNTKSAQTIRSILFAHAQTNFCGRLKINEQAQKSDASQYCHNLLMHESAEAKARPQLEVLADDVKAAHGATMGKIRDEEIFYLQSRAINKKDAENLFAAGFQRDVVRKVKSPLIAEKVKKIFASKII